MHETLDVPAEEAVKVGKSSYYHQDCLEEKNTIDEIIALFLDKVNNGAPMSQLRRTINDIVYKKGTDAKFLLFGLKYFVTYKRLNYPGGLYYVIQDKDVIREWDKYKMAMFKRSTAQAFNIEETNEVIQEVPSYKKRNTGFSSILGG